MYLCKKIALKYSESYLNIYSYFNFNDQSIMSKREQLVAFLLATNISFPVFTSCVDDSYDLSKDIDMTVNVGGNIVIPGSETEEITLSQIMDLEENSIIQTNENGDYELRKSETNNETSATVDPVTLEPTGHEPALETLHFYASSSFGDEFETEVDDVELAFTFENTNVTDKLVALRSADVTTEALLRLSFDRKNTNIDYLTLREGFEITFKMDGQDDPNPDNIKFSFGNENQFAGGSIQDYEIDEVRQSIRFLSDRTIRVGTELCIPIKFQRIQNFPENQGLVRPGFFRLSAKAISNGKAAIHRQNTDVSLALVVDADFHSVTIDAAEGIANPDINIEDKIIEVTGIPDFLADENTVLDLKSPVLTLEIDNPSPFNINVSAKIVREKDNHTEGQPLQLGRDLDASDDQDDQNKIIFYGETPSIYYLSRYAMPEMENPALHQYNRVLGDGIYELTKTIPDKISLTDIEAKAVQEYTTFHLGDKTEEYRVTTSYSISAPLQFGPDVHIEYNDTMADWSEDLEDFTIREAHVTMDATNGIPLDFVMSAKAIDKNGNECKNISVEIIKGDIEAGYKINRPENPMDDAKQSQVELVLRCNSDDMTELDGLAIKFAAENNGNKYPDAILNENMTLRLSNIRFRITDGVTIDLN